MTYALVAAEQDAQCFAKRGLRLHGDDARVQPAKGGDAVTHMGADVEDQIAGRTKCA